MTSLDFISQVKQSIANLTDPKLAPSDLSLTSCDREPIHISNAIQPHGVLLTFCETDFIILQISQNSEALLGQKTDAFLGQPLSVLLNQEQIESIRGYVNADFETINPLRLVLSVDGKSQPFEGILHRTDGVIVLELEQVSNAEAASTVEQQAVNFYKFVKVPIERLQNTQTLAELSQQAVTAIRSITGFDRVMLYRFDDDGSGHVIAENASEGLEPFLGLHYPASDIPKQAKELYRLKLLRVIPDALSKPVFLEPKLNPITVTPLDLSQSTLRSVSPLHTEYMENMGVRASMSISLLQDRHLWGLISCHHNSPKRLSYETRTTCEVLGQIVSLQIGSKTDVDDLAYELKLQTVHLRFTNTIAHCQTLSDALHQNPHDLIDLTGSSGVVSYENSEIASFGSTPPEQVIAGLVQWVDQRIGEDAIYSTNSLVTDYPEFAPYKDVASGLLALRVSLAQQTYLLWFRPEVIQTIDWAGDPHKPVVVDADSSLRMAPRKSFERWKETVQLKSLPWKTCEINAALELRISIIGIVLQKVDELALLNTELERSNIELDSFAHVASHDLKEPLRGIYNYSTFLIEDYGDQLGAEGTHKLATLMRLTQRMEDLINSLLYYSQLNRAELLFQPVELEEVVKGVLDVIKISQTELVDFRIPRPLPMVQCDRTQFNELFANLISNAIKYNDQAQKWVEIGYILPEEINLPLPESLKLNSAQTVFFVKDNGIGIRAKHSELIFKIFKRLHSTGKYGGGTGAGLTIVKKIVERHGGNIAVESIFGEGSTFYFTLGQPI